MKNLELVPGNSRNPVLTIGISEMGKQAVMEIKKNVGMGHCDYYSIPNLDYQINVVSYIKKKMKEDVQLHHYKLVIIIAGGGEDVDIQASKIIAESAAILGLVVIVFTPVQNTDNSKWMDTTIKNIDLLVAIPLIHNPFPQEDDQTTCGECYQLVISALKTITTIGSGKIRIDLADILTCIRNKGKGYILEGEASGNNRAGNCVANVFISQFPLQFKKAKCMIIRIASKSEDEITLMELSEILDIFQSMVHQDCEILWDYQTDSSIKAEMKITLIICSLIHE